MRIMLLRLEETVLLRSGTCPRMVYVVARWKGGRVFKARWTTDTTFSLEKKSKAVVGTACDGRGCP
jgi:hypothetical protein